MKYEKINIFDKYEIKRCIEDGTYSISIEGKTVPNYYFTNLDTALLMLLIKKYLRNKPEQEQVEFCRVMADMINMYKNQ